MTRRGGAGDYIAGWKTAQDWRCLKTELEGSNPPWQAAFETFFVRRIALRYLNPIKLLQEHGTFEGEGFSIVAIQCTLIEFLAATRLGKSYRLVKKGEPPLDNFEYSNSSDVFIDFLSSAKPFSAVFTHALAQAFYRSVRCGLLHEARTKDGWTIWAKGSDLIDPAGKVVFRDNLQAAIDSYINSYGRDLVEDPHLQSAFIRKFDSLAS